MRGTKVVLWHQNDFNSLDSAVFFEGCAGQECPGYLFVHGVIPDTGGTNRSPSIPARPHPLRNTGDIKAEEEVRARAKAQATVFVPRLIPDTGGQKVARAFLLGPPRSRQPTVEPPCSERTGFNERSDDFFATEEHRMTRKIAWVWGWWCQLSVDWNQWRGFCFIIPAILQARRRRRRQRRLRRRSAQWLRACQFFGALRNQWAWRDRSQVWAG